MGIAPEVLLNLQSQRVHAPTHVRHPGGKPHPHTARNRDHRRSSTAITRANAGPSTARSTITLRPPASTISIRPVAGWPSARKQELNDRLAAAPQELPDIHPNVSGVYRRKVARLAKALGKPEERDAAAAAIRGLIDGIVLTPGDKRGQLQVTLRGELGNILEWTGSGAENEKTDTPLSGMSVSVVAGAGFELATFRL